MRRYTAVAALFVAAGLAAQSRDDLREEFHQTYAVSPTARVSLKNVNGAVHVTAWDRNEVKVDAVKHARTQQALNDAQIVVDARADAVDIQTKYPEKDNHDGAAVEYTVSVPRRAALDRIGTVNGGIEIAGAGGEIVRGTSVNGDVNARDVEGEVDLSSVNGRVEADFARVASRAINLKTVNGGVVLSLPAGAGARLNATTLHGGITSDFEVPVRAIDSHPGSRLETTIGSGGPEITLRAVNGGITLRRR